MRKALLLAVALSLLYAHTSTTAMGEKKVAPARTDKVTYAELVKDHPALEEMVDENGFNDLSGEEQWELITMVDKYYFFQQEGEYYAGESPSQSMMYLRRAKSLKKEIEARFGHVIKE
ncbi:MAG: hypothetical protein GTN74_15940 [Proteobacteria bacterium]|nr:hypothetical protein [Pseudomonadota bacterium]NIS72125.1 hypothetical protein [Pseudomonadota bacterium]